MLLRFPFLYNATVNIRGIQHTVPVGAWGEVELTEATAADAPVVVSWTGRSGANTEYQVEVRQFGEDFFRPMTSVKGDSYYPAVDGAIALSFENMLLHRPLWTSYHLVENLDLPDHVHRGLHRQHDPYAGIVEMANVAPPPGIVASDFDFTVNAHMTAAANILIIDGEAWERCPMPELEIEFHRAPPVASIAFRSKRDRESHNWEKTIIPLTEAASIDGFLAAMARPELLISSEAARPWTPEHVSIPRIHLTGDYQGHPSVAGNYAVDRTRNLLRQTGKQHGKHLASRRTAFIRAWADLTDAVDLVTQNATTDTLTALLDAWALLNTLLDEDTNHLRPADDDERAIAWKYDRPHFNRVLERSKVELGAALSLLDNDIRNVANPRPAPKV